MSNKIAIKYNKKNICRLPIISYTRVKKEDIIAGVNLIDAEYWKEAKKHTTVQQKLEDGTIQEIKTNAVSIPIEIEEEVEEDGKKKKTKKKGEIKIDVTDFDKLNGQEKENLINETFHIKTLEILLDKEENPSIRYTIQKRIDFVKNAKSDETIGHPESHLKH